LLAFKTNVGSLRLVPSSGGVFEVSVNGQSVYSKKATGQFPDPDAVVADVRKLL
jgi:selenoprotein W-related protein